MNYSKIMIYSFVLIILSCNISKSLLEPSLNFNDYKDIPSDQIVSKSESVKFKQLSPDRTADLIGTKVKIDGYDRLLTDYLNRGTSTVAFIALKNDTLLYERYFEGYKRKSEVNSFGLSYILVNALTGIAIQDGYIHSTTDLITKYIPQLGYENHKFNDISIHHLLNMQSGLILSASSYDNSATGIDEFYFNDNHYKELLDIRVVDEPGNGFSYQNLNLVMMGIVLENATGKKLADYAAEKIWEPLNMQYSAKIGIDSKENQNPKTHCCLKSRPIDLVRLASLYANDGQWNGKQILPKEWVRESLNDNYENSCFKYGWRAEKVYDLNKSYSDSTTAAEKSQKPGVFQKRNGEETLWYGYECKNSYFIYGLLGQYIYIDPSSNIAILRLGKSNDAQYEEIMSRLAYKYSEL